jgi:hypothetical protein
MVVKEARAAESLFALATVLEAVTAKVLSWRGRRNLILPEVERGNRSRGDEIYLAPGPIVNSWELKPKTNSWELKPKICFLLKQEGFSF